MAGSKPKDPAPEARFVFRGKVKKIGASNVREVPGAKNTAIVHVEEAIDAPRSLRHSAGQDITVEFTGRKRVKAGDEAVFFTEPWLFANEGVAVRSLDHRAPDPARRALLAAKADPVDSLHTRDLQHRLDEAHLCITGRVTAVQLVPAATPGPMLRRPSEHDPKWQEATVAISRVQKGQYSGDTIAVWFPSSIDKMWYHIPKLRPGNEGIFLLHPLGTEEGRYAILHPEDFESRDQPGGLKDLIPQQ